MAWGGGGREREGGGIETCTKSAWLGLLLVLSPCFFAV